MEVIFEPTEPEKIVYHYGIVYQYLYGWHAWLYRAMIGMYGKEEATERFWYLWHKRPEEEGE